MESILKMKNLLAQLVPFPRDFFLQNTVDVAEKLIGAYLVHRTSDGAVVGRIVETEAYREDDPASHSYRGPTERNRPMFEDGGIAYVYFIYGMYNCFNVVAEPKGIGCAVLVRALEPVYNKKIMWENRFPGKPVDPAAIHHTTNGPGKLCRAMGITREHNGVCLSSGLIRVLKKTDDPQPVISTSTRIGIRKGGELPWRFFDAGSVAVSRPALCDKKQRGATHGEERSNHCSCGYFLFQYPPVVG